jgi:hypothetical protein
MFSEEEDGPADEDEDLLPELPAGKRRQKLKVRL